MKFKALLFLNSFIFVSLGSQAQSDTLITLEGDTSYVKITRYSDNNIAYQFRTAEDVTFENDLDDYLSVDFANPDLPDYEAPRHWAKSSSLSLSFGIDEIITTDDVFILAGVNLVGESMLSRHWGYQFSFGGGTMFGSLPYEDLRYIQASLSAIYRIQEPGSGWSAQLAGGLIYRGTGFDSELSSNPAREDLLGLRFTPGIFFTTKGGFEIGLETPVTFYNNNSLGIGIQPRIGFRF
ncbi:MAG: hypothetical protein HWD92_04225 [Flavobacteriia bacterium]|nr:hypothetical protein [Flavobacteriia bacterium]